MKVLICDPVDELVIDFLKKNRVDVDNIPDIGAENLLKEVKKYNALVVRSRTKVTQEVIGKGVNLKIIGRVGVGTDNIDKKAAEEKKIIVVNSPGASSQAVAELTIGLILTLLRKINIGDSSMKSGTWKKKELRGSELNGKILGIIGYGNIGRRVAEIASCFGAGIKHHDRDDSDKNLQDLLKTADIISLHMNLNSQTKNFLSHGEIALMKKNSFIINCARAELIDEDALFQALKRQSIAGAALDLHWNEPPPTGYRFAKLENVVLTPHIAGQTREALYKATMMIAEHLIKFKL